MGKTKNKVSIDYAWAAADPMAAALNSILVILAAFGIFSGIDGDTAIMVMSAVGTLAASARAMYNRAREKGEDTFLESLIKFIREIRTPAVKEDEAESFQKQETPEGE
jgi:hypothetical protein